LAHTPIPLKVAALGFLLVSAGLFTIPHNAGFSELIAKAVQADQEEHLRTFVGFGLILIGLVLGGIGLFIGAPRNARPPGAAV
jgi:uncharacterized protein YjeT (DUF2065 family)